VSSSEPEEPGAPGYSSRRERRAAERAAELAASLAPTEPYPDALAPASAADAHAPAPSFAELVEELSTAASAAPVAAAPPAEHVVAPKHPAAKRRPAAKARRTGRPRFVRGIMSVGAATFAAALAVGLSIPASLFGGAASSAATTLDPVAATGGGEAAPKQAQGVDVSENIIAAEAPRARDGYSSQSMVQVVQANFQAAGIGIDPGDVPPATSVSWPFDHSVPISSGFGPREDGEFHYGIDLDPGEGAPIGAIADGIVTWVGWDNSGYGYYVVVAHTIDGLRTDSLYGHMIDGSSPVYPGEAITKGTILGLTGDTGYSFGAHCHLEIHVAGVRVDPYPWMTAHADNGFTEPTPGPP